MTRAAGPLDDLLVVVPAHDEEERLDHCLTALAVARARVPEDVVVRTVVVLDACSDRSAEVAAVHDVDTVVCQVRNVGTARALGVLAAARGVADPRRAWVATTDADSVVPTGWLRDHLRAAAGHDLLVGRVVPDDAEVAPPVLAEWGRRHRRRAHHVHGANLGIRLSTYVSLDGFRPLPSGEDVALVQEARRRGARTTGRGSAVVTSGRLRGRAPAGFADYLADLAQEVLTPVGSGPDSARPDRSAILVQSSGTLDDGRL